MIFFMMRTNRKLRLQAFLLAFVIGSGILPSKIAEGLRCYACDSRSDETYRPTPCEGTPKVVECSGSCLMKIDKLGAGDVHQRLCDYGETGKKGYTCALEISSDACFINSVQVKNSHTDCQYSGPLGRSSMETEGPKERGYDWDYRMQLQYCYCNTDLCNGGFKGGNGNKKTPGSKPGPITYPEDTSTEEDPHHRNAQACVVSSSMNIIILASVTVVFMKVPFSLRFSGLSVLPSNDP